MKESRSPFTAVDIVIIAAGLITTALALGTVAVLGEQDHDFNIMGWYALFILPAGAILVGAGAGAGYGLASWWTGRKVSGALLVAVVVLQIGGYGLAQWVQFQRLDLVHDDGSAVRFGEYFDATTRSMQFTVGHSKTPTAELGVLGYLFRLLELIGFAGGGLVVTAALRGKPYCDDCSRYMRTRLVAVVPAAVPVRKVSKKDAEAAAALERDMASAHAQGAASARQLLQLSIKGDAGAVKRLIEPLAATKKSSNKLLKRFHVSLSACPSCHSGLIACEALVGHGKEETRHLVERHAVTSTFVQSLA